MFLTYLYTTHTEIISEGDDLSIFGLLSYNIKSDEFTFDDPYGFIQNSKKDELAGQLTKQASGKLASSIFTALVGAGLFWCAGIFMKRAYDSYKTLKAEQQAQRLMWEDQNNRIEGAPI